MSIESLGVPPQNFIVQSYVPQLEVLEYAAAFVTHGGMNSVSESLAYNVPVLVIPQMGEQAIVGRRVEELGAGLFLAKSEVTPENLRVSVRRLLVENSFREQATLVCESFRSAEGASQAVEAIRAFTRQRTAL